MGIFFDELGSFFSYLEGEIVDFFLILLRIQIVVKFLFYRGFRGQVIPPISGGLSAMRCVTVRR